MTEGIINTSTLRSRSVRKNVSEEVGSEENKSCRILRIQMNQKMRRWDRMSVAVFK
jgi:hypothetical protein